MVFARFLNIAALWALCFCLRTPNPDEQSRITLTLVNSARTAKTVLGFLETPGDDPPRVIDVAQTQYPKGNSSSEEDPFKFAFIADENALRILNNPLINEMSKTADNTTRSPPPLKVHLMRKLSSEVLEGHVEKLNRSKELYCMLGASSRGYTWPKFSEDGLMVRLDPSQLRILADFGLTSQFLAEFEAHLSRESPKDAFVLKAMDAEIFEYDPGAGWVVNPEFNGNRLCELLSRSQTAAPLRGEKAEDTCKRQLKLYSEYISPPVRGIYPDTWPLLKRMHPGSMRTPHHVENIFNWLTNGTMKPKD